MPYYPKSQVKTDLYTQGGQLQLKSTKKEYKGYYWKTSKGEYFTKKNPNVGGSEVLEIIPKVSLPSSSAVTYVKGNDVYNTLKKVDITKSLLLPSYMKPSPTEEDYDLGNFTRYFAKKNNENIYIEISKDTYDKFSKKNAKYAYTSYSVFQLIWTLTGTSSKVLATNQNIIKLTEQNNKITGLGAYLKFNYLEFYALYTKGGEYNLPDGQEYIGFYHIHPNKGAMVGRTHIPTPHDILTPVSQSIFQSNTSQNTGFANPTSITPITPQSSQQQPSQEPILKLQSPVPLPKFTKTKEGGDISGY